MRKVLGWLKNHFKTNFDESWGRIFSVFKGTADHAGPVKDQFKLRQDTAERAAFNVAANHADNQNPDEAEKALINEALRKLSKSFNGSSNKIAAFLTSPKANPTAEHVLSEDVKGGLRSNYAKPGQFSLSNLFSYFRKPEAYFTQVTQQPADIANNPLAQQIEAAATARGLKAEFVVQPMVSSTPDSGWKPFTDKANKFGAIELKLTRV